MRVSKLMQFLPTYGLSRDLAEGLPDTLEIKTDGWVERRSRHIGKYHESRRLVGAYFRFASRSRPWVARSPSRKPALKYSGAWSVLKDAARRPQAKPARMAAAMRRRLPNSSTAVSRRGRSGSGGRCPGTWAGSASSCGGLPGRRSASRTRRCRRPGSSPGGRRPGRRRPSS